MHAALKTWKTGIVKLLANRRATVDDLADIAHPSVRQFERRFARATGLPPGRWLTHQRVRTGAALRESAGPPRLPGVPGRRRARRGCFGDGAHARRTGARGTLMGRGARGRWAEARRGGNARPITGGFPAKGTTGG
ncbi:hypothetical protein GCM10010275_13520 [Streptomyces litmocidini]|uniref:hypothetical protein n=1 Tax=Streptomyces litmocidini TaxID=67318 RepID=UPI00167DD405|nr:hypothetical protein [Streptomyces litmocidini]GGU80111.1 hypothetical protein GCM10010275_13520 [Streptomyces litmocidini]